MNLGGLNFAPCGDVCRSLTNERCCNGVPKPNSVYGECGNTCYKFGDEICCNNKTPRPASKWQICAGVCKKVASC